MTFYMTFLPLRLNNCCKKHSYIANGLGGKDGALVVDLRNLGNITIDDAKGTAVIETGNRLGDIAAALGEAGKALPHGTCSYVGIGGHAGMASSTLITTSLIS